MKRLFFPVVVCLIALGAVAASKALPGQVRDVITRALINEREAIARYEVFAVKAQEEGYPGAAALFRAQIQAEKTHAQRFAALLKEHDVPLPAEESFAAKSGSTEENLRAAASAETTERDRTYREASETCHQHGATAIAKVFDQTRDTETEHANLCMAAARNLESMKEPKTFYVCSLCGYTTDVKLSFCPACSHKGDLHPVN